MNRGALIRLFLPCLLIGCVAPSAEKLASSQHQRAIAESLGYFSDQRPPGRYEISDPWVAVTGEVIVCVASHLPDGKGGYFPAAEYALYAVDKGKITSIARPYDECRENASFKPLEPVNR